jgi:hypothetical protein
MPVHPFLGVRSIQFADPDMERIVLRAQPTRVQQAGQDARASTQKTQHCLAFKQEGHRNSPIRFDEPSAQAFGAGDMREQGLAGEATKDTMPPP